MKRTLTTLLLMTATYLSLSITPPKVSDAEADVGIFRKNPKESIEDYMVTDNATYFDNLKYRFVIEETSPDKNINNINGKTYAILLNGVYNENDEGYTRFKDNIRFMHDALSNIGVNKDNIFIVQDERSGDYKNRFDPTRKGLEDAISNVNKSLKENDLLVFYITNHGNTNYDDSEYQYLIGDAVLNDEYLLNKLNGMNAGAVWFINATCKSYHITSKSVGKIIGYSFTGPHQNAVGGATAELTKTINTAATSPKSVDMDNDGLISIMDLAKYTALNYEGTSPEGKLILEDYRREVHYITYQDVDPKNIIIK